jgi:hypothetical protein
MFFVFVALAMPARAETPASANSPVSAKNAQAAVNSQPKLDQSWRVSAGFIWRNIGNLNFQTHSSARGFAIPSAGFGDAGDPNSLGGHLYRDGFVNTDPNTASTGESWNWGYQNDSQLTGTDLAFHGTTFSETRNYASNPGWNSDLSGGGPIIAVNWDQAAFVQGLRVGAEFSVSLVSADADQHLNTMRVDQQAMNIVDHYTIDPIGFPGAPFAGTFAGPGPLIPASPTSREFVGPANGAGGATFFDDVHESFDLKLTTLSLGPTVSFQRAGWSAGLSAGFALNVASWNAEKTDTLYMTPQGGKTTVLQRWHSERSGTEVLPGGYVQATVRKQLRAHWSIFATARYDWAQDLSGEVGGSSFRIAVAGWSAMGGIGYAF